MTNIFIRYDEQSQGVGKKLESYIRSSTVYNLSVKEQNAEFCISLNVVEYPREPRLQCYHFNAKGSLGDLASKIYYQCSKAGIATAEIVKGSMPREEYEQLFVIPTLIVNLGNENTVIDEIDYAIAIGQGIVSYLNPGAVFDTFSSKKKNTVKKDQGKSFSDKNKIVEPTNNTKLLFKKK